ncbi:MAG TPA: NifU family protein [Candidatus Omnitrophota bacterium]|nr:NifU family protein [Candidatus Omnitrophota bacterium]
MDVKLMIQSTPNPNALKFVLNKPVKTEGNFTYKTIDACEGNPLARAIFETHPSVKEVYFFDNYITVTQDGSGDWDELEDAIKKTILDLIKDHDPHFKTPTPKADAPKAAQSTPEVDQINAILDQTVRPALQMDGGDIQVIEYQNNLLKVHYQGACGSCPSSTMGTLQAIQNILKNEFNPDISVELAEAA